MTHTCDWPGCTEESTQPFTDGWCACGYHGDDLGFLPDPAMLCPRHSKSYEDLGAYGGGTA
jgi:hypothetical protein